MPFGPQNSALDPRVGEILRFQSEDLASNRRGVLSEAQRLMLQTNDDRRQRSLRITAALVGGVPLAFACAATVVWTQRPSALTGVAVAWPMALLFGILAVALVRSNPPAPPVEQVDVLQGTVNIVKVVREVKRRDPNTGHARTRHVAHHEMSIGGRTFAVPAELATVLPQGQAVRAYVSGGVLVSLEADGSAH